MSHQPESIPGEPASGLLLVVDHASSRLPADIELGIDPALLSQHVAIDIGVDPLARRLAAMLHAPAILATVSRLVIDLNREEDSPGLIPERSDGHEIPGNHGLDAGARADRIARFWAPYHAAVGQAVEDSHPRLLVSLHSFTPRLRTTGEPRPWEIGILYNADDRAARLALPLLAATGVVAGDNQPYSGKLLNATMNRHAEANGIPYLGIEVRQDLIDTAAGIERWSAILAPVIETVREGVAPA